MSACIITSATVYPNGYAYFRIGGRQTLQHRHAYEEAHGPIPDGYVVHHRCEVRACANPDHLEAMPRAAHTLLHDPIRKARAKTHCVHGHERTPDNIYTHSDGRRGCRACIRERNRAYKLRMRAA
jgi:hypothetical protein